MSGEGPADLAAAAGRAVEAAVSAGASDAEVWAESTREREVRVHAGEVESLTQATGHGIGVRAWIGARTGYAYGTDLSDEGIRQLGAGAAELAGLADEDEHAGPADPGGDPATVEGLRDPEISAWSAERVVELAKAVERGALDEDDRVSSVEQAVYVDVDGRVALATSLRDEPLGYEASSCYAYTQAMAGAADDRQTGLGFGVGRSPASLDPEVIGREAGAEAVSMLGSSKPASRSCPAVLADTVAASFAGFVGGALCADSIQRGRSPFAGRLGQELASTALVLTDDGLDPDGLSSAPFDGEGTPCRRTPLIEGGRLLAYLHDTYTARREGASPTGNAFRSSYRSAPSVSTSNLVVKPGAGTLEELVAEAEAGVFVTDVAGLHSGVNPVTGQFSVGASGRLIKGGELAEPVREFTIAGDLVELLASIRSCGGHSRWIPFGGSVKTPPLLVAELAIGGT